MGGRGGGPRTLYGTLCSVIRLDHFKFASYGPAYAVGLIKNIGNQVARS